MSFVRKVVPEDLESLKNETLLAKMKNDSDVARRVLQDEKLYGRFLKVMDNDGFAVSNVYAILDREVVKDLNSAHAEKPEVMALLKARSQQAFSVEKVLNGPQPELPIAGCMR